MVKLLNWKSISWHRMNSSEDVCPIYTSWPNCKKLEGQRGVESGHNQMFVANVVVPVVLKSHWFYSYEAPGITCEIFLTLEDFNIL